MGSNDVSDPNGVTLRRGRLALEALRSREQAARVHAAVVDLQIALMEAEGGNDEFLRRWLNQNRSWIDQDPEMMVHFASIRNSVDQAETTCLATAEPPPSAHGEEAIVDADRKEISTLESNLEPVSRTDVSACPTESPWSRMIAGARQRAARPLSLPTSMPAALVLEKKPSSQKNRSWMSSSVAGSAAAHLIALIGMSAYVIHRARNPEPKSITASVIETETISMEAPMEMSPTEDPTLSPSPVPLPTMPSFDAAAAATSNHLQLPLSMTGLLTDNNKSSTSNALQQATTSPSSNSAAAQSVQFFGAKAAGNTFCYVVDGSPSMKKDDAFAAAKAELVRSLSSLKSKQRFYISFFGGEVERMKLDGRADEAYPVYATPENLQKTLIWIDRVRVQPRGLPPNAALLEAIQMEPDGIFLLFDGDTTVDVAAYLRKANRSDDIISGGIPLVQIHTIGFYTQEFEGLMKRIASENRGSYHFVPKPMRPR